MYFIAAFGVLMLLFSLMMLFRPYAFAQAIINFSEQPYFHPFEISSRLIAGGIFVAYAADTQFPLLFKVIGLVLLLVGTGLALTLRDPHEFFIKQPIGQHTPQYAV
jgi:hydrogenase/urease accessory protein HupE